MIDEARELLREVAPLVGHFAASNPQFPSQFSPHAMQDPYGAHSLCARIDAFLARPQEAVAGCVHELFDVGTDVMKCRKCGECVARKPAASGTAEGDEARAALAEIYDESNDRHANARDAIEAIRADKVPGIIAISPAEQQGRDSQLAVASREIAALAAEVGRLKGELQAAKDEITRWNRSFAGHVYVENEEYSTLCAAKRELAEAKGRRFVVTLPAPVGNTNNSPLVELVFVKRAIIAAGGEVAP